MILVTGATGFVGRALIPRLVESGADVRCLIRPSKTTPRLPRGVAVQVAVAQLDDVRGLRAACSGVDTIIHLASSEWRGSASEMTRVDQQGSMTLLEAARSAGVGRIVYLSHLGADRNSAFAVHRVKGVVEDMIRKSGLDFMIVRSGLLFGAGDAFTNALAMMMHTVPGVFWIPADGRTLVQPLWIDDLVTCLEWGLDDSALWNMALDIGGPEFFTVETLLKMIMARTKTQRTLISMPRPYLRLAASLMESVLPRSPFTTRWVDHFAVNRTCELTSVTRFFSLRPSRMDQRLGYLENRRWGRELGLFVRGLPPLAGAG